MCVLLFHWSNPMPPVTVDSLLQQAMTLSIPDRELLAIHIYESLEPVEGTPEENAAAWHQEIHNRLDQYDRGETQSFTLEECLASADDAIKRAQARRAGDSVH